LIPIFWFESAMQFVSIKVNPPSGTIVLNRSSFRNALNREMLADIAQGLFDLHQEKRVRAVIFTGAGNDFCSGLDLGQLHEVSQRPPSEAHDLWREHWELLRDVLEQMLRFPKPLVAALDGAALGSGFALALACDLVVGTPRTQLGVPAIQHGLIGGSVAPLLSWRIGGSAASRLLFTGEAISVTQALQYGLVHECVPSEQVWVRAHGLCEQIAKSPAEAIQLTKRLLNENIAEHVLGQLATGTGMGAASCTTEAAAEGLRAFVEKRVPQWP
jgi:methylglutaconyl-CoA hydratase